jgi:hypothetical protein
MVDTIGGLSARPLRRMPCVTAPLISGRDRENTTGWRQEYPLNSLGFERERRCASQRYRNDLGEYDVTKPLSLRLPNIWSTSFLPGDAQNWILCFTCLEIPSNRDHTCGDGERAVLHGVCSKFMQGQPDLLGNLDSISVRALQEEQNCHPNCGMGLGGFG